VLLPIDTAAPTTLVAGTNHRLPLCACCYQVVIGYNMCCLALYWRSRLLESDSNTTCNLSITITTQILMLLNLYIIFDTNTILSASKHQTSMYSGLELSSMGSTVTPRLHVTPPATIISYLCLTPSHTDHSGMCESYIT
jgi:hypothetical protein